MPDITMHLQPLSGTSLEAIPIEDALFPIGRGEPWFASLPKEQSSKLSRRHARIFAEQGQLYLTDLDSRNGTTLNGKSLVAGRPQALRDGDLIELAGELSFRVDLNTAGTQRSDALASAPAPQLTLKPVDPASELDVIVVNQFPFLIARKDSIFEAYNSTLPDQVSQISRRHALITHKGGELFVEDLGSRNGTAVNGVQLDEHAQPIVDGDTLAIGGDHFVYQVSIPVTEQSGTAETQMLPSEATPVADAPATPQEEAAAERTMFVDSPTSFLDIFCDDDKKEEAASVDRDDVPEKPAGGKVPGPPGKLQLARQHAREIKLAFTGKEQTGTRKTGPILLAIALVAALLTVYLLYPSDKSKIQTLLEDGEYLQSARVANRYLASHPQDSDADNQGAKALLMATMPAWLAAVQSGAFEQASALLEQQRAEFSHIDLGVEYLDLLQWTADLDRYAAQRGGIDGPLQLFQDEITMQSILDQWNRNPNRHLQLLGQISVYYPDFNPLQKHSLSQLRQLRHDHTLYGQAITDLSQTAIDGINSGDVDQLLADIADYSINYPRLLGLDVLKTDAEKYRAARQLLEHANLGTLVHLQRELEFDTPLFRDHAQALIAKVLPGPLIVAEYEKGLEAWRQGDVAGALAILRQLEGDSEWSEQVQNQIQRFQSVDEAFKALGQNKSSADYQKQLLQFRQALNKSEDAFYLQATDADFEAYKSRQQDTFAVKVDQAAKQWAMYIEDGGINSVLRIEDAISSRFTTQAGRLGSAYAQVAEVMESYKLLDIAAPARTVKLNQEILGELRRQRQWIKDLGVVIDTELLQAKLDLLPTPTEQQL